MPRSQFGADVAARCVAIDGWDSDDCSESRSSSEPLTTARSVAGMASSAIRLASTSGSRSSHCLSRSCPIRPTSDFHDARVVAQQVAHRAAVRVRARQGGEVAPGHLAGGLLLEPGEHAGVGEPVHRVERPRCGREPKTGWMVTPPTYGVSSARLITKPISSSLTPERGRHGERREDPGAGEPLDRALLEAADVGAAVVGGRLGRLAVVLQVDLDPLAVPLQQVEQRVVLGDGAGRWCSPAPARSGRSATASSSSASQG